MRISLPRGSLMGGSVFVFFLPIGWFSDHPYENQPFRWFSSFFAVFRAFSEIVICAPQMDRISVLGALTRIWTDEIDLFTIEQYNNVGKEAR